EVDGLERRMLNPFFEVIEGETERLLHAGRMIPVHGLTRGVTGRMMRLIVRHAIDVAGSSVADPLPEAIRAHRGLAPLAEAIESIHFPADDAALARARRRLVFEELFLLQTMLELRRRAV